MHEFALAQAVVDAALQAADEAGISRITKIAVRIGELQQMERESFAFALKEVMPTTEARLAGAVVTIESEPARLQCRPCQHAFSLDETQPPQDDESEAIHFIPELAHAFLRCPQCRSSDFEVIAGRGVTLQSVEGDT
ncbi:MAG: hydrogenase nickel incorporation protein HypA [Candidatus Binatia bacterium]